MSFRCKIIIYDKFIRPLQRLAKNVVTTNSSLEYFLPAVMAKIEILENVVPR